MKLNFACALTGLTGAIATVLLGVAPSIAQDLPGWKPEEICASDSAQGQCLLFENRARNDIAASWAVLPDAVRNTCLTRFKPPLEPSWRILGDCIEIEGQLARQQRAQKKREDQALAVPQQPGQDDDARSRRLAAEAAAERKRIETEEASFMATLAAQREADAAEAERKVAAKKAADAKKAVEAKRRDETDRLAKNAAAAEAEKRRVAAEEASFMATLAAQRQEDEDAKKRALAARKLAEAQAAEVERQRVATEEATFMAALAAQRKADEAAQKKADAEKKLALARAEEAERKRVAAEEATFMAMLAQQRKADEAAQKQADSAKKLAATAAQNKAAQTCEAKLKQIKAAGVITFAPGSAKLSDTSGTETLDRLAAAVGNCEGQLTILVEGHTDTSGSDKFNITLSKSRAEAVAKYLRDKGVAATRISSRGFGSSKPIAANTTPEGRAKNRRIEFKVK